MPLVGIAQGKNTKISFEVDGVCGMCKKRIEKVCIKTKGVRSAIWDIESHQLSLIYDSRKVNLDSIKSNIVSVGHDTQILKSSDKAYSLLSPCCKYRDADVVKNHK